MFFRNGVKVSVVSRRKSAASLQRLAAGPEYRTRILGGDTTLKIAAQTSLRRYQKYQITLDTPPLAGKWLRFNLEATDRNYPQENFFGLSSGSLLTNRTDYKLEDTSVLATIS